MQKFLLQASVTKFFYTRDIADKRLKILDIGLDNASLSRARLAYPNAKVYHGLDISDLNETEQSQIDRFFQIDLDKGDLGELEDGFYDLIIMNHVIEHLEKGLDVVYALSSKVANQGSFFIEFPNVNSLKKSLYCNYHFHCDATHKRIYEVNDIVNLLISNNFEIISAGYSKPIWKAFYASFNWVKGLVLGKAVSVPHLSNKISHVYARKR
jgi:hypothetical protein